jgi:hypothetical protein
MPAACSAARHASLSRDPMNRLLRIRPGGSMHLAAAAAGEVGPEAAVGDAQQLAVSRPPPAPPAFDEWRADAVPPPSDSCCCVGSSSSTACPASSRLRMWSLMDAGAAMSGQQQFFAGTS